jgi:simple sugar transport system permease protein
MDGGKYSLTGSIIGALVMQTLTTTILTYGVPVQYTLVVKALVVFVICLIQSASFRALIKTSGRRRAEA